MPARLSREEIIRRGATAREDVQRHQARLINNPGNPWIQNLIQTYQIQVAKYDRLLAELNAEEARELARNDRPFVDGQVNWNDIRRNPVPLEDAFNANDGREIPQNPGINNQQFNVNFDDFGFINNQIIEPQPILRQVEIEEEWVDNFEENEPQPDPNVEPIRLRGQRLGNRIFDEVIQDEIEKQFHKLYNKKPEMEKYEKTYKTILVNKRDIIHIECPKDNIDSKDVLYAKIQKGNDYKVQQVGSLPNDKNLKKKYPKVKLQLKDELKNKFKSLKVMSNEEFWELNNHLFTIESNKSLENTYITNTAHFRASRSLAEGGTCAKYIFVCGTDAEFRCIRGFTTGKYNHDTGMCEVIGARIIIRDFESRESANYIEGSKLQKYLIHYGALTPIEKNYRANDYIRIKVNSCDASIDAFGNKSSKKLMIGKLFNPSEFRIQKNFDSKKLGKKVDCVDIITESGTFIKFLMSDVSFMYVNPELVGSTKKPKHENIQLEARVKIIDDRRITLNRDEQVVVKEINKNQSNIKNSRVKVLDSKNQIHFVLLKQLKLIENNVVKTENRKPKNTIVDFNDF